MPIVKRDTVLQTKVLKEEALKIAEAAIRKNQTVSAFLREAALQAVAK